MRWVICFSASNEMWHFLKTINNNKHRILFERSSRESQNKVHGDISQRALATGKGVYKSWGHEDDLHVYNPNSYPQIFHISFHFRPKEMLMQNVIGLCYTKMTHKTAPMSRFNKQILNRSTRNAKFPFSKWKPIIHIKFITRSNQACIKGTTKINAGFSFC